MCSCHRSLPGPAVRTSPAQSREKVKIASDGRRDDQPPPPKQATTVQYCNYPTLAAWLSD